MRVMMAQFKVKAEALEDFEAAREKILAALSEQRPKGVRYTWCGLADGVSFIGWLELGDGVENPLLSMEAGREFMEKMKDWVAAPPTREELRVVGAYGEV